MLKVTVPATELFDEENEIFINVREQTIVLEHSLVSISKWESKWHIPFLHTENFTMEQTIDYVKCMTITQNVDPMLYKCLDRGIIEKISNYIAEPMTATTFSKTNDRPSRTIMTSERIYYWMIELGIPMECQKWHLNRLLTLIRVVSIERQPDKKMSKSELANRNRSLNAARRKALHSKG